MSQVLKVVTSRNEVQEILYTNIRIQESDNLEIRRQKRALKRSVSLYPVSYTHLTLPTIA